MQTLYTTLRNRRSFNSIPALLFLVLACQVNVLTATAEITVGTSLKTGIDTQELLDEEPYGFAVRWIHWYSGFRHTDLKLGDIILAVDGVPYVQAERESFKSTAIGQFLESKHWEDVGATDGQAVILLIQRDQETLEVTGPVRAERFYSNAEGVRTMDEGGPPGSLVEKDENGNRIFDTSWSAWYERKTSGQISTWPYILNNGWERSSFNNRKELEDHLEDEFRINYLVQHYPSTFATEVQADWQRIRTYLEGVVIPLTEEDLAYRTRLDELKQDIQAHSDAAIAAFETELGDRLDTAPSAGGDIEAQRQAYLGKVVYFDGLLQRNIINDLDLTLMVAGSQHEGYVFLDAESLTMAKAFDALLRYKSLVNPKIAERYAVYIEVLDDPRIITFGGSAVMGLMGKLVAIAQGQEEVFVDARLAADQDLAFAGEIETQVEPVCALEATDAPEETIKCMVDAIKQGDEDTWRSLFADWRITPLRHGLPPLYDPEYHVRPSILLRAWEHSRRFITSDVYDARINRVSSIKVVHRQGTGDSIPTIEEAMVVLDHVGLIDDEFRTFVNLNVRRVWRLQSQDAGPWKITDIDHL